MAKKLITGAEFWDFDNHPIFIGVLGSPVLREKDGKGENQKAGSIMGWNFTDRNGEVQLIGASHQIEKAVGMVTPGAIMRIEFKGQIEGANGKVNRFGIDQLDDQTEWDEVAAKDVEKAKA